MENKKSTNDNLMFLREKNDNLIMRTVNLRTYSQWGTYTVVHTEHAYQTGAHRNANMGVSNPGKCSKNS